MFLDTLILPAQGKRHRRKRPIRKFGVRIEVGSDRIDESASSAINIIFSILESSYNFVSS